MSFADMVVALLMATPIAGVSAVTEINGIHSNCPELVPVQHPRKPIGDGAGYPQSISLIEACWNLHSPAHYLDRSHFPVMQFDGIRRAAGLSRPHGNHPRSDFPDGYLAEWLARECWNSYLKHRDLLDLLMGYIAVLVTEGHVSYQSADRLLPIIFEGSGLATHGQSLKASPLRGTPKAVFCSGDIIIDRIYCCLLQRESYGPWLPRDDGSLDKAAMAVADTLLLDVAAWLELQMQDGGRVAVSECMRMVFEARLRSIRNNMVVAAWLPSLDTKHTIQERVRMAASGLPWAINERATGARLLLVPSGIYSVGGWVNSPFWGRLGRQQMNVVVDYGLYVAETELTEAQFQAIDTVGNAGIQERSCTTPMTGVDGDEFTRSLAGCGMRLPSETEWEIAASCGGSTRYPWGDDISDYSAHAWKNYSSDWVESIRKGRPGFGVAHGFQLREARVRLLQPNRFGLFDMIGSVSELCLDRYSINPLYPEGDGNSQLIRANSTSLPPYDSRFRVHRGSSSETCEDDCATLYRARVFDGSFESDASQHIGVRPVMAIIWR